MGKITMIAAIGKNRELGLNNQLIWKIPEDLAFFRENTMGKHMVMGINTLNSLPKLLPGRKHIILTHKKIELDKDIIIVNSIEELLNYISRIEDEIMIIGGASIYSQMIEYADKMLLTEIDCESEADVYFPEFVEDDWNREVVSICEYNGIDYSHVMYTRKRVM